MSASGQKHDYHLVDPSPWPLATSIATLVTAFGSVYYFHSKVMWAMVLGFLLIIYCAFMWFRDVVIEAEHKGHHTPVVQIHHRYGMTLFIASEVMFFVAWFWAYFDASLFPNEFMGNVWPPKDIETFDPWGYPTYKYSCPTFVWYNSNLGTPFFTRGRQKRIYKWSNLYSNFRSILYVIANIRIPTRYI